MKNNTKRTLLLAAIPLLLGLPSCGEADNTIHFWCTFGEGAVRPAVQSAIDKFCELVKEKEGVDVKFSLDYQGDYNTLLDKVKKSFSAGGTPTIAVAYPDHVADYLAMEGTPGDYVYDLTKYVNDSEIGFTKQAYLGDSPDYDEDDFVTAFYEEGKQYQREGIYSLPFMKSSEVMAYNENAVLRAMKFWKPEITTASALRNYLSTISWTEFIEMNKVILQNKDQVISSLTCPIYYDSDANFLISKICQLEIPYASVDENGKGHIDFETGEARTKVEDLVTSIKEAYDAKLLETKGIANKYGSTAFQNQQCLFVIGSSGGSGYSMPKAGSFTANVVRVPSSATNPLNRNLYVTQGPTITFLKNRSLSNEENDRRMHYSWMLAKYLTNPEVNTNVTLLGSEGYIPVRDSAYETDLWIEWSQVGDMVTKAANTLVQDINGSYLTTKVFKGSASLREKIGGIIASVCKTGTPVSKAVGDAINAAKTQM